MLANTLVLPLPVLGGYLLIHLIHYLRFRAQRLDGQRLMIECGLVGAFLLLLARLMTYYLHIWNWWPIRAAENWWNAWAPPVEFLGTAACSLLLGAIAPLCVNSIPGFCKDAAIAKALQMYGNSLQLMLFSASTEQKPLMLTLQSRKVYVGWIVDAPNLKMHESHLKIIPMISGYRSGETLEIVPTQDYTRVYNKRRTGNKDFAVAIPLANVQSCSVFDKEAFLMFLETRLQVAHLKGQHSEDAVEAEWPNA